MRLNINYFLEANLKISSILFKPYRSQINSYFLPIPAIPRITSLHLTNPSPPSIMVNACHSPHEGSNADTKSSFDDDSYGPETTVQTGILVSGNKTYDLSNELNSDNLRLIIPRDVSFQNVGRTALIFSRFLFRLSQADLNIQTLYCSPTLKVIIGGSTAITINHLHEICVLASTRNLNSTTIPGNPTLSPRTTTPTDIKTHLIAAINTISSSYPAFSPVPDYIHTLGEQIKSMDMQSESSAAWLDFLQTKIDELSGQEQTLLDKHAAALKAKVDAIPADDRSSVADYLDLLKTAIGSHGTGAAGLDIEITEEEEEEEDLAEVVRSEENYDAALNTYVKTVKGAVAELDNQIKEFEKTSGTIYTGPAASNTTALKEYLSSLDAEIQNDKAKTNLDEHEGTSTTNHTLLNEMLSSLKDAINDRIKTAHKDDAKKQSDAEEKLSGYHHAFLHTVQVAREEFEKNVTGSASTSASNEHSKRTLHRSHSHKQILDTSSEIDAKAISEHNLAAVSDGSFTSMRLETSAKFRLKKHRNGTTTVETVRKTPGSYGPWESVLEEFARSKSHANENENDKRVKISEKRDLDAGTGTGTGAEPIKLIYLPQNASTLPQPFWRPHLPRPRPNSTLPQFNLTRVRPHRLPRSNKAIPRSAYKGEKKAEIDVTEPSNRYHRIFSTSANAHLDLSSRHHPQNGTQTAAPILPIVLAVRSSAGSPPRKDFMNTFWVLDAIVAEIGGYTVEFRNWSDTTGSDPAMALESRSGEEYDVLPSLLPESQPGNLTVWNNNTLGNFTVWNNNTAGVQQNGTINSIQLSSSRLCPCECGCDSKKCSEAMRWFRAIFGGLILVSTLTALFIVACEWMQQRAKKKKEEKRKIREEMDVEMGGRTEEDRSGPEEKAKEIDGETLVEEKIGGGSS
jgi:hypothetical protein